MSDSDITAAQIQIHDSLYLLGIVILYYDHLMTFAEEWRYIWRKRWSIAFWLFFINRYFSFFAPSIFAVLGSFDQKESLCRQRCRKTYSGIKSGLTHTFAFSCSRIALYRQIVLIVAQVTICVNLLLRTYALYNRDKRIRNLILAVGLTLTALTCWGVAGQKSSVSIADGCHIALSRTSAIHIAIAWEALLVYDVMIVILTLLKTYSRTELRQDLLSLIIRDGAIYFSVMACASFANTLTFYFLAPALRGVLSTFASAISVTMMSRLMLNLHSTAAEHQPRYASTTQPSINITSSRLASRPAVISQRETDGDPRVVHVLNEMEVIQIC